MKSGYIICTRCKGNGFLRVPYKAAREEVTVQCDLCNSQGEIPEGLEEESTEETESIQ
jgi:DnaJ-class molecular chaperone